MKARVIHIITMLELGGAQQNTIYTVTHLDRGQFLPALWSGPGGILTEEAEKGVGKDFKIVPNLVREISPRHDLGALLKLRRMLKAEKEQFPTPVIVHTHSSKAGILGRVASRLAGIPIVVHTFHGFGFNDFQTPLVRRAYILAEKITGWLTDGFIFVSRANMAKAEQLGIGKKSQYHLIRSGVWSDHC